MDTCYLGQIVLFAGGYAPEGFLPCDGRTLTIADNEALYALLGTVYGGDGRTNFSLPDLRGRIPISAGQGFVSPNTAGGGTLTAHSIGAKGGSEGVSLTPQQIPSHTHTFKTLNAAATTDTPVDSMLANVPNGTVFYIDDQPGGVTPTTVTLGSAAVSVAGGSQPHMNVMPVMPLSYIICTRGIFPELS